MRGECQPKIAEYLLSVDHPCIPTLEDVLKVSGGWNRYYTARCPPAWTS